MFITAAKADDAGQVLGLAPDTCSEADITAAFRKLSATHHPDAGGSAEAFARLSWAKEALVRWVAARPMVRQGSQTIAPGTCRACGGVGRIRKGSLKMFCSLCNGTGNNDAR